MAGKVVEEFKLRVVYVLMTTSSAMPEDSEQGSSARPFAQENGIHNSTMPQPVSRPCFLISLFCALVCNQTSEDLFFNYLYRYATFRFLDHLLNQQRRGPQR